MFMCVVSVRSNRDFVLFEGDAALSDGDADFVAGVIVFSPFTVLPVSMSRVVLVGAISNDVSIDIYTHTNEKKRERKSKSRSRIGILLYQARASSSSSFSSYLCFSPFCFICVSVLVCGEREREREREIFSFFFAVLRKFLFAALCDSSFFYSEHADIY